MIARLVGNPRTLGEAFTVSGSDHMAWGVVEPYRSILPSLKVSPCDLGEFERVRDGVYQIRYDRMLDRVVDNLKVLEVTGMGGGALTPWATGCRKRFGDVSSVMPCSPAGASKAGSTGLWEATRRFYRRCVRVVLSPRQSTSSGGSCRNEVTDSARTVSNHVVRNRLFGRGYSMTDRTIRLSGIRLDKMPNGCTRLAAAIGFEGFDVPYTEKEIWFEAKDGFTGAFTDATYDPFLLVPMYLAMYHGAELRIEGRVSKLLHDNMVRYGQAILCDFSDDLRRVPVTVDGFVSLEGGNRVGTGISCGVDSLSTIKDRFADEDDPGYRITDLFLFNCGTHGDYGKESTDRQFEALLGENAKAAEELGLPLHAVNSNLHAFSRFIGVQKMGYFAIYSCILSVQRLMRRYYVSSTYSYEEQLRFHNQARNFDMAEYCEGLIVPLIQTETFRLVLDGAQYRRSQKVSNIADWDISRKYLNVCVDSGREGGNCSVCSKCKRTLIALESLGMLDDYSGVFDIEKYRSVVTWYKFMIVAEYGKEGFTTDGVDFARQCGLKMPSRAFAIVATAPYRLARGAYSLAKKALRRG